MQFFFSVESREIRSVVRVIILPNVTPQRQRELFRDALLHIGKRDLVNAVLEVDRVGTVATCREYPYPFT